MRCRSTNSIEVDHIKSRSRHHRLRLRRSNVQILCKPCNQSKGSIDDTDYRPLLTRGKYKVIKFLYCLLAVIIISIVIDFLRIDYGRGWASDTTIAGQVWSDIQYVWHWVRN